MIKRLKSVLYWITQNLLYACSPRKYREARSINLIYKPDAIGDFLLASGVVRELLSQKPGEWALICSPQVESLARHLFPEILLVVMQGSNRIDSGNALSKIRSILPFCHANKVEKLICLRHSLTGIDHVLLKWLDPETSIGIQNSPIRSKTPGSYRHFKFTHQLIYPEKRGSLPLEVHAHLAVVSKYLNTPLAESACHPFLNLHQAAPSSPPQLAIFPVTRAHLRNYPLSGLAKAVNIFLETHNDFHVHVYGTKTDESSLHEFKALLKTSQPVIIEYPASILDAAYRIKHSSLMLCLESAPAHIATALDIPMVCILGGGHFDYFAPWGNQHNQIWLSHALPCYHCNWSCIFSEPMCITKIDEYTISNHLLQLANSARIS